MALNSKQLRVVNILKCLQELEDIECKEYKIKTRAYWVNPFLLKREVFDIEAYLLKDLNWGDGSDYKNFVRMSLHDFQEILNLVEHRIKKQDTPMRIAVSARIRLAITLRFLAAGDSYRSLEFLSRVSRKTISEFIPVVLKSVFEALQPRHMEVPKTQNEWIKIVNDFDSIWHFPHTLGAVDGKHIRIKKPPNSGTDFYNYKNFFSMILIALVDAHSKFIYINVGANGKSSDSTTFKTSKFYSNLNDGSFNIPVPNELMGQKEKTPYFIIADSAFGLGQNVMKQFNRNVKLTTSQQAYNYRLSRARMTVEMAFGRLASRFRIFHCPIELKEETIEILIKTSCVLHNFLTRSRSSPADEVEPRVIELPTSMKPLPYPQVHNYKLACRFRDRVALYCITDGDVAFQWNKINKN